MSVTEVPARSVAEQNADVRQSALNAMRAIEVYLAVHVGLPVPVPVEIRIPVAPCEQRGTRLTLLEQYAEEMGVKVEADGGTMVARKVLENGSGILEYYVPPEWRDIAGLHRERLEFAEQMADAEARSARASRGAA